MRAIIPCTNPSGAGRGGKLRAHSEVEAVSKVQTKRYTAATFMVTKFVRFSTAKNTTRNKTIKTGQGFGGGQMSESWRVEGRL